MTTGSLICYCINSGWFMEEIQSLHCLLILFLNLFFSTSPGLPYSIHPSAAPPTLPARDTQRPHNNTDHGGYRPPTRPMQSIQGVNVSAQGTVSIFNWNCITSIKFHAPMLHVADWSWYFSEQMFFEILTFTFF